MIQQGNSSGFGSILGGDYLIESRLKAIKGSLADVTKKINELDDSMMRLLFSPDLIQASQGDSTSTSSIQVRYMTDSSTLYEQIMENMSFRKELMTEEQELLTILKYKTSSDEFNRIKNQSGNEKPGYENSSF